MTKRNGEKEEFSREKILRVVRMAAAGVPGVSVEEIEKSATQYWPDEVSTDQIQSTLIKITGDLTQKHPGYSTVASKLLNFAIRDRVWGSQHPPSLYDFVVKMVELGKYDPDLLTSYTKEEFDLCDSYIDHGRDFLHDYAGMVWLVDKYMVQDRTTGTLYETPQLAYMMFAMADCMKDPNRFSGDWIRKIYDQVSLHEVQLSTPPLAGCRTPIKQFASCTLIDIDDTLPSIGSSLQALLIYASQRAGLGINIGRIRPIHSRVGHGEIVHTGVAPFLKAIESSIKSVTQGGIRSASATVFFPWWHGEVETLLVLQNPTRNTVDRGVFKLDYCIQFDDLFYERLNDGADITLLNGHLVPGLYEAFGTKEFRRLYEEAERNGVGVIKKIPAGTLFKLFLSEAIETGRRYVMNLDEVNRHSSFKESVKMSNLCLEITQVTTPIKHIDDPVGEIGICILSAINWTTVDVLDINSVRRVAGTIVRLLDNFIEYQNQPVKAGHTFCTKRRSLAIGITGLATWLARQGLSYDDPVAPGKVAEAMEIVQYCLIEASVNLAIERGPCEWFEKTRYAEGILPIDTYRRSVDQFVPSTLKLDWERLRNKVLKFGMRHSTLTAQPPCESSSLVQNTSNGIEPPRGLITPKKSRDGYVYQVVKESDRLSYSFAYHRESNAGYLNIVAAIQKFMDMSISAMLYYAYERFPAGKIPLTVVASDVLRAERLGIKTIYYMNTDDGDEQSSKTKAAETGCDSGACQI